MRSLLLIRPDLAAIDDQVRTSGADAVLVDLAAGETAGLAERRRATVTIITALRDVAGAPAVFVGIHPLRSSHGAGDLESVLVAAPHGIFLPEGLVMSQLGILDAQLSVSEALHGIDDGSTRILAGAAGLQLLDFRRDRNAASRRLVGIVNASLDRGADARLGPSDVQPGFGTSFLLSRALCAAVARATGLPALDQACTPSGGPAELSAECRTAREDGFSGKLATHPDQVAIINDIFSGAG